LQKAERDERPKGPVEMTYKQWRYDVARRRRGRIARARMLVASALLAAAILLAVLVFTVA
jgi:hypothetical protein